MYARFVNKLTPAEKRVLRAVGRLGGKAAAANLTPQQRKARAQKAAQSRWNKQEKK